MTQISHEIERQTRRALDDAQKPDSGMLDPDRTQELRTPGFARMRLDWDSPEDRAVVASIQEVADKVLFEHFSMAYELMNQIFDIVREPEIDEQGEVLRDRFGLTVWKTTSTGAYIEDWSRLGHAEREDLLFKITAYTFQWEQAAANLWGEAMFAKAAWEERFARGFRESGGKTVDDRTQGGRLSSQEERYFSIFRTLVSKKAEALVRSVTLLNQRMKDTTV